MVPDEVRPFWRAVLGYREPGEEDLADPRAEGPWTPRSTGWTHRGRTATGSTSTCTCRMTRWRRGFEAALAAGGHLVTDRFAPGWWTLADAEGNECDVATWWGRE